MKRRNVRPSLDYARVDFVIDGDTARALHKAARALQISVTAIARQALLFELYRLRVLPSESRPVIEAAMNRQLRTY